MGDFSRNRPFSEKGARRAFRKFLRVERPDLLPYVDLAHVAPDGVQVDEEWTVYGDALLSPTWAVWFPDDEFTNYIHHRHEGMPDGPRNPICVEWYGTGFDPDEDEDNDESETP